MMIENRDWPNWEEIMSVQEVSPEAAQKRTVTRPRPGHTDLAGSLKFNQVDARNILERSSARETTARVAAGGSPRSFSRYFGIEVLSHTTAIGTVKVPAGFRCDLGPAGIASKRRSCSLRDTRGQRSHG